MAKVREGRTYSIAELGGACPTQATGRTPSGRPYYFRARHGDWTLEVGEPDFPTDYVHWPTDRNDWDALRTAKLETRRDGAPPAVWAAFTVVGDPLATVALRPFAPPER